MPDWFDGAVAVLKNNDLSWNAWNERGMAIYAANNSEEGFAAFDAFSSRSGKYSASTTRDRWRHYFKCPPTQMTAGKLHYFAQQDDPEWRGAYEDSVMTYEERARLEQSIDAMIETARAKGQLAPLPPKAQEVEQPKAKANPNASWRDHVYTAAALQHMVFPQVAFCVPDLIPEGLTIIAGKPKIGKSWLALDVCIAIAAGLSCLDGRRPAQGDVLYAAMEDNPRRLQKRIHKLLSQLGIEWPARLMLANSWRKLDKGGVTDIGEWIAQANNPRLVVLDTLAGVKPIRTQQGYTEDYESLTSLHRLSNDKAVPNIVLHHTRKLEAEDPVDTVSGTLGLAGCADSILVLNRTAQGTTLYVRGRDIEEAEHAMSFDKHSCRWAILGEAREVHRSEARNKILFALEQATEALTPQEIADRIDSTSNNVRQLLFHMAQDGEVLRGGHGKGSKYCHCNHPELVSPDNNNNG